ncbi:fatty acid synthase-like [Daktulosphaira vitifoliae]|uniref:fatty acid synthase-like n=1 Tax=Daktulosphaira vitifoliae TaxID=58002 RepID=UPI0021A9E4D2|nr:fatty acid synthase-like [Daktulosphaira vitifoliae]
MPEQSEVVISGIAGRFPECDSTEEFKEKLYNNADLLTIDNRRWSPGMYGAPSRSGKLKEINKFDAEFFGIHAKLANSMDIQLRILLEVTHEAIMDAGVNPQEIRGTNTGVYVGMMTTESSDFFERTPEKLSGYETIGAIRSMLANRLSFQYDLKGPSVAIDTACSSGLFCLYEAISAIKSGHCDAAIVAGTNLLLKPAVSVMYHKYNMLSPTGTSRPFDIGANGYVRSEAIVALYIRKSKDAKRIYATVVGSYTNTDGFKTQGATYPSRFVQSELIRATYARANLKPTDVHYVEAHGTGTGVGDKQELDAISDVFCEGRKSPLLIGSVKSNVGHSEPVSGLVSIAKVIYALETGIIPANINFETLNHNIEKLVSGELKVVDKQMPLPGDLVSINSFGVGGTNVHIILKAHNKNTQKHSLLKQDIPRLVFLSGRTRESLNEQFEIIEKHANNADLLTLIDDIYKKPIPGYKLSGYSILGQNPSNVEIAQGNISGDKRPIYFIFPGMGSQSLELVKDLIKFPVFKNLVERAHKILLPYGFSVNDLFYKSNEDTFKDITNVTITIVIVQMGLTDILSSLGIIPDGIIGHSVGELACAYADGCFTVEQTLMTMYWRSRVLMEIDIIPGAMVAVGLSWEETIKRLPEGIIAACHNSADSVTISGPKDITLKFAETLQNEGIFAKPVDSLGYAFHSPYLQKLIPALKPYYSKIMTNPKPRTNRWKSTSLPESQWNTEEAKYSSMEYHLNNISSPVYFHGALQHIPENAITIEIASHCLLQAILKRALPPTVTNVGLTKKQAPDHTLYLLEAIGKLYIAGAELDLQNLYGKVEYPVSKNTPMISPMIKWDHSNEYVVPNFVEKGSGSNENVVEVSINSDQDKYLVGHTIDGRVLYPAAGYMTLIWKAFAKLQGKWFEDVPVVFQNLKFLRPTVLNHDTIVKFEINILNSSGDFELLEGGSLTVSGNIRLSNESTYENKLQHISSVSEKMDLKPDDFYKELRLRGYQYKDDFLGFIEANIEGSKGKVAWTGNWVSYIDTLLQFELISKKSRKLRLPTYIKEVVIDPLYFKSMNEKSLNSKEIEVNHFAYAKTTQSGGVTISKLTVTPAPLKKNTQPAPTLEHHSFIPYNYVNNNLSTYEVLYAMVGLIMENVGTHHLKVAEIYNKNVFATDIVEIIEAEANFYADYSILSNGAINFDENKLLALDIKSVNHNIKIDPLPEEYHLIVFEDSQFDTDILNKISSALTFRGFVLLIENTSAKFTTSSSVDLQQVAVIENNAKKYFLLKKVSPKYEYTTLKIEDEEFSWFDSLKKELENHRNNLNMKIILYSDKNINGVLGLAKCLVEEYSGIDNPIRCILAGPGKKYTLKDFAPLLEVDLFFNVERDGKWGSYRHLPIDRNIFSTMETSDAVATVQSKGDLTTLQWVQASNYLKDTGNNSIKISYVGINNVDLNAVSSMKTEFGVEFSGIKSNGKKVMGLVHSGALSSSINENYALLWDVPQNWTLQQAATVPFAFSMATYALVHKGKLPGLKNVLVYANENPVNYAIISLSLSLKCKVFVVAESTNHLEFISTHFPGISQLSTTKIDTKFVNMVLHSTSNHGVDYVVASNNISERLPELLAENSTVIVIEDIDMSALSKSSVTFGVLSVKSNEVLSLVKEKNTDLYSLMDIKIKNDLIKPLPHIEFLYSDIESAFRTYNNNKSGKKIIVEVNGNSIKKHFKTNSRIYFDTKKSYILSGGLGGFGLELTDWAITRGAKNIVLCSRSGLQTGYQKYRVSCWKEQGANIEISTYDLTTLSGAKETLKLASSLGPVSGIFNLAGVLRDAIFENQIVANFHIVYDSKVLTTKYLDEASRSLAENLDYFVTFSSISCGRGNRGQTNYGYANSIMERISEERQKLGLAAQSIQWGGIGDVGMAYLLTRGNDEKEINGTLGQKISSCLKVLDIILPCKSPVVASHVIPNKRKQSSSSEVQSLTTIVANIMGIQDPDSIKPTATLADLGMDSLMGVDIKQSIERSYKITMTNTQIQQLKFSELEKVGSK